MQKEKIGILILCTIVFVYLLRKILLRIGDIFGIGSKKETFDISHEDIYDTSNPTLLPSQEDQLYLLKAGEGKNGGFNSMQKDFSLMYSETGDSVAKGNPESVDTQPMFPEPKWMNQKLTPEEQKTIVYQGDGIPLAYEARITPPSLAEGSMIYNHDRKCSKECCQGNVYSSDSCCVCWYPNIQAQDRFYAYHDDQDKRTTPL